MAGHILGEKPDSLSRGIWAGRLDSPQKGPSGSYIWTLADIEAAAWVLHRHGDFSRWLDAEMKAQKSVAAEKATILGSTR